MTTGKEMSSEQIRKLLVDYLNNELGPSEKNTCRELIENDPRVQAEMDSLRETTEILSGSLQSEPAGKMTDKQRESLAFEARRLFAEQHENDIAALGNAVESRTFSFPRTNRTKVLTGMLSLAAAALMLVTIGVAMHLVPLRRPGIESGIESTKSGESRIFVFDPCRTFYPRRTFHASGEENILDRNVIAENYFRPVSTCRFSLTSVDIPTGGYEIIRNLLLENQLPDTDSVRPAEMVNFFSYDYTSPNRKDEAFRLHLAASTCPWKQANILLRVAIKGSSPAAIDAGPSNLVFILDLSSENISWAVKTITDLYRDTDNQSRLSLVYNSGKTARKIDISRKDQASGLLEKLNRIDRPAGTTEFELAYSIAESNRLEEGSNRVIFCSEGHFNDPKKGEKLDELIEKGRKKGITLDSFGFGMRHVRLPRLETMATIGGGEYRYVDSRADCRRLLKDNLSGKLCPIAANPRLRVEFNPAAVAAWKFLGCTGTGPAGISLKEAGKPDIVLSGHTYTALYEIIPVSTVTGSVPGKNKWPLKYLAMETASDGRTDLATAAVRYIDPKTDREITLADSIKANVMMNISDCDQNFRFAAAVAGFGILMKDSRFGEEYSLDDVERLASDAVDFDPGEYRKEFLELVRKARVLTGDSQQAVATRFFQSISSAL